MFCEAFALILVLLRFLLFSCLVQNRRTDGRARCVMRL